MRATHPVVVENLSVTFRQTEVLRGVSAEIGAGVTGILGPNGAGKSTLLAAIATAGPISGGTVTLAGHDIGTRAGRRAARARLGWLPQSFEVAGAMRVREAVEYAAWAQGIARPRLPAAASRALALVDLTELQHARVKNLSGGQRQRLGLAATLAHEPEVLLLDEPTVALDPEQRVGLRRHLRAIGEHRSVVFATHQLDDVRTTCDALLVIVRGRVVFQGPVVDLAALGGEANDPLESPLERGYRRLLRVDDDVPPGQGVS